MQSTEIELSSNGDLRNTPRGTCFVKTTFKAGTLAKYIVLLMKLTDRTTGKIKINFLTTRFGVKNLDTNL